MATYTVTNTMSDLVYELSEREIYNDMRAEIGIVTTETEVIDATYSWRKWDIFARLPDPGNGTFVYYTAEQYDPVSWALELKGAQTLWGTYYADYRCELFDTNDDRMRAVYLENTGTKAAQIHYIVKYKYVTDEEAIYEIPIYSTLKARATDETSIKKYARRALPLVWPQGASESVMQGEVNAALNRYKEVYARLILTLKGDGATNQAIIYNAEISDTMTVTCTKLGLTSTSYFIDAISIKDEVNIPVATFELVEKRAAESAGYFVINVSLIGGTHVIG